MFYMFTGGIFDQHSPEKKKIGSKGFIERLEQVYDLPIDEQKSHI